jgi:hypothetical protein
MQHLDRASALLLSLVLGSWSPWMTYWKNYHDGR